MNDYQEPNCLVKLDRSWGDKQEELRLEQGEYQGKPTYSLRVCWRGNDGKWRWAQAKPSQSSGKCWQTMNIRADELEKLGEALIAAARGEKPRSAPKNGNGRYVPPPQAGNDDDIPF
jgi:hypothetical protein